METEDESYHKKILSKLTGAVLEEFVRSKPSKPLPSQYKNCIAQRLHGFFPILRTPSHPTYAAMINTAISEMEDDGGSTEEAISEFIKKKFEDLPWAHASLLSHHLKKLSQRGELISISENCYMLPSENADSVVENGDHSPEGQIVIEENQSLKQVTTVRNENRVQWCQIEIDNQKQSQEQLIKQTGEGRQEEWQVGFSNEQCLVGEKQTEFKEKQNGAQSFQNEDETMEDQQFEVKEKTQEERQNVARRHELEEIGGKSLLQDQQMEEQNQAVFCEPIKSGEIYEDEEFNQAKEPQVEWICDLKQAEGQFEGIEEQSQAQRQLTKVKEVIAQESEEVVNALSPRKIEAFKDQMPVVQKHEVSEEEKEASVQALTGYGNAEHTEKQQDEVIKEPKQSQQIQATQQHSEVEGQSKMINEQTQEQHNEAIKYQSQSSEQQNQQEDERYVGRIPTQLEDIAVAAVQKSKAERKNKATEELEQEHRIKEPQNEMPQGKKQIGYIDRREQLLEEQIELIDKLTQLQRRQNEAIDERNKPLQKIDLQIYPSIVQELFEKQPGKTDAADLDPSAIMVLGGDGLLPRKWRCMELLERTKKIEGELLEILNFLSVSEVSNHSNLESMVELEERQPQIDIPCRDVEYIAGGYQFPKLQQPQICGQNNAFNSQPKQDEYPIMEVFPSSVEQNDSKKQKPQRKGQHWICRSRIKPEAALSASLPLQNENLNLEKQQQPKKRGRPPKPKPVTATTTEELMSFEHQKQQEQSQKKRRGRPPKSKLDGDIDLTEQAGAKREAP